MNRIMFLRTARELASCLGNNETLERRLGVNCTMELVWRSCKRKANPSRSDWLYEETCIDRGFGAMLCSFN